MSVAESQITRTNDRATHLLPVPAGRVNVRPGELRDVAFMDRLQKLHGDAVGWMPTKQFEGKIEAGHVLVAQDLTGRAVGYCIGSDRYFKRDDVGIIYQMNVEPGRQRGLVGATLLRAQFERSAYGCRLYCCWCAQDLPANRFWESMGFVPLAVRAGSDKKRRGGRTHIFWQKRITSGDDVTPWWFPSKTDGGALRAGRLAIPIPPGVHWSEARPLRVADDEITALPAPRRKRVRTASRPKVLETASNGLAFSIPKPSVATEVVAAAVEETPKPKKPKVDPRHVAAARELRDRYLEQINHPDHAHLLVAEAKYDVERRLGAAGEGLMRIEDRVVPALPAAA